MTLSLERLEDGRGVMALKQVGGESDGLGAMECNLGGRLNADGQRYTRVIIHLHQAGGFTTKTQILNNNHQNSWIMIESSDVNGPASESQYPDASPNQRFAVHVGQVRQTPLPVINSKSNTHSNIHMSSIEITFFVILQK